MDTTKLVAALDQSIAQDRSIGETIFLRLLKEVWQVDWSVAPSEVFYRMVEFDISYFLEFMDRDEGDEAEEYELMNNWVNSEKELEKITPRMLRGFMIVANRIRDDAQ